MERLGAMSWGTAILRRYVAAPMAENGAMKL